MQIVKKLFSGVYLIKNKFQKDKRGKFIKFKYDFKIKKEKIKFNQFCYSFNKEKYTLRGIHFQKYPFQEKKLVTCVGTNAGPLTVGPMIAAPISAIPCGRKDKSFSLVNTPGEIICSAIFYIILLL